MEKYKSALEDENKRLIAEALSKQVEKRMQDFALDKYGEFITDKKPIPWYDGGEEDEL